MDTFSPDHSFLFYTFGSSIISGSFITSGSGITSGSCITSGSGIW